MLPLTTVFYRLGWAALLGSIIGAERTIRRRPAGMRTSVCVTVAAALFTIVSVEIAKASGDSSTTRIASNIVQGVGFLGAGVIMSRGDVIIGVTTASVVWVLAAIGALIGAGEFAGAVTMAIVTVACLTVFDYLERWIQKHR